jgi:hypothetical protein
MDFSLRTGCVVEHIVAKRLFFSRAIRFFGGKVYSLLIGISTAALALFFSQAAFALGDPQKGAANWDYLCDHCHSTPQPNDTAAFKAYGKTANPLSLYASNPAAITKAINAGYIIPKGNTNDDYEPGSSTALAMGSFVGMGNKRMGVGETPTEYAIDISAYLASYFEVPGVPTISAVAPGNGQASVSFTAPKSDLPITSYTVTANPGGITASGSASPVAVPGLTNGVAYTFTVKAESNAGAGKPSSASNAVTLAATQAVAMHSAPVVPAPTAAAPVAVTPAKQTPAATIAVAKAATANAVPDVAPPKPSVAVAPVAAAIANAAPSVSAPANKAATTQASPVVSTGNAPASGSAVPAPVIIAAKPGSAEARVFFTVPQDALTHIANFTVVAYSGGKLTGISATGPNSPIKITGLTNGSEYTFYVFANGKSGAKVPSVASNVVTPLSIFGN